MNKKKVSVVMAGAMLASSVAPVLAAEVQKSEVSANELGLLQDELRTLLESKVFANDKLNAPKDKEDVRNQSVYAIYVNGKDTGLKIGSTQEDWQNIFNDLDSGDKVEVYSKGFKEVDGKCYHYETKTETPKYTSVGELETLATTLNNGASGNLRYSQLIKSATVDKITNKLVVEFKKDTGMSGDTNNSIEISLGDTKINENKYVNAEGKEVDFRAYDSAEGVVTPGEFYGFATADVVTETKEVASEKVKEYTITPGGYDLTVDELYDGLMLTEKGHDFFTAIKEAKAMGRKITIKGNNVDSAWIQDGYNNWESNISNAIKMVNGKARFSITFGAKDKLAEETYTITGTNEANAERLAKWMIKPLARVDILAGDNRYETAAKISKEYADIRTIAKNGEIVLVNGNALVDGLAAAPLASTKNAPILLTESDSLPKATKAFLKEVLAEVKIGKLDKVTINLVGGDAVLSRGLERELKSLGFSVERFGGNNREETSLEVAEAIEDSKYGNDSDVYVVGAQGEADAMSIAAVAAETRTPIIVSANGGISEEATYELRNKKATVIGGEAVVSEADYNAIKAEADGVTRVFGANRQATNAEIIKKFYKGNFLRAENVIVAKDGRNNKMELVDALSAANMAAAKNAPIVLATNSLSTEQKNALILNAKNAEALYQVGHGVSRDVVKTIARELGLTNR